MTSGEYTQISALIVDIVASRELSERAKAQESISAAFAQASTIVQPHVAVAPTVGDEFQGIFSTVHGALTACTLAPLLLPNGVDIRCGIGLGSEETLETKEGVVIRDGSAWWNARAAIDEAHRRQSSGTTATRTWFTGSDLSGTVNAYLVMRDHIAFRMKARERRLAAALLMGITQKEMASREKITQASISETLHRCGAVALRDALGSLREIKESAW